MFGYFKRRSLITQVTVIFILGVIAAQIYPIAVYVILPSQSKMISAPPIIAAKVQVIRNALEAATPSDREKIRAAIEDPSFQIRLMGNGDLEAAGLEVSPFLTAMTRTVHDLGPAFRIVRPIGGGAAMVVADLEDGTHVIIRPLPEGGGVMFILGRAGWLVMVLIATGATIYGLFRLTKPLRALSRASERVGVDLNLPPLPLEGPAEIRRTNQAFNRMVERVRGIVANRSLMMASISHDLRTMLTRLRLRVEGIPDPQERAKAIDDIEIMRRTLEANIAFAKSETPAPKDSLVDLAEHLERIVERFHDRDPPVGLHVQTPLRVRTSAAALDRAVMNLVDNAVTYGRVASVRLRRADGAAVIEVVDDGPGIPADARQAVLEPFYRLDKSRRRETGGDGLGLSIADAIIRNLGGQLTIADADGGGALVAIRLPEASG